MIVMNPPFRNSQDIDHVRHAYDFLMKGGTLISIMSPGFTFRSDKKAQEFLALAQENCAEWRNNPNGSFVPSGTNVNTLTFCIMK